MINELLDAGANIDYFDEHWGTALQAAAREGHTAIVKALAETRMDTDYVASGQRTALIIAAANGCDDVVKALFALGVESGTTWEMTGALVAASSSGKLSTVQLLVDNGGDVNGLMLYSQTASYCRPLQAAASKGHIEMVKFLLTLGAHAPDSDEGYFGSALMAAAGSKKNASAILTILLDAGADVDAISPESSNFHGTSLCQAIRLDQPECVSILVERGANVNVVGPRFTSPLMLSTALDREHLMDYL